MNKGGKILLVSLFAGLSVFGAILLHHYQGEFKLAIFSKAKEEIDDNKIYKTMSVKTILNVGKTGTLRMTLAIPYENAKQRSGLRKNMTRLENDFLMNIDQAKMAEWVEQRNFAAFKKKLLRIVNSYVDKPVETLYFESFLVKW